MAATETPDTRLRATPVVVVIASWAPITAELARTLPCDWNTLSSSNPWLSALRIRAASSGLPVKPLRIAPIVEPVPEPESPEKSGSTGTKVAVTWLPS